jgi:xylulokinase
VTSELILAVDAGSTSFKTVVFDRNGRVQGRTSRSYETRQLAPGRAEQDPDDWLELLASSVAELRRGGVDLEALVGIGLSARGGLAVFLDASGAVLEPVWLDNRAAPEASKIAAIVGEDLDPHTRRLASKTAYLRTSAPERFSRLRFTLFVRDFLQYRLTGTIATDPSSGPPDGAWSRRQWDAVGFPVENLAPIRQHTEIAGGLSGRAAERLGLPAGLPVGIGGHDGACANAGAGAIRAGQVCLTLGTWGVARAVASELPENARERRIFPWRFLPGRWCCSGDLVDAGATPTLVARLLGGRSSAIADVGELHDWLIESAREVDPGSAGVVYLPFPEGQSSPEFRPDARAAFVGLSFATSPGVMYRAALEGVAGAFRSVVEREREIGLPLDEFRLSGGGARNPLLVQILADVLDEPLVVVEGDEGARGTAMFLAVGLGWFASPEAAADAWVHPVATIHPSSAVATYEKVYRRFREIADAVYEAETGRGRGFPISLR